MTQRRVLREPSQHATCLTDYLQAVIADDEADCQLDFEERRKLL